MGNTIAMGLSIGAVLFTEFYTDTAWIWYVMIGTAVTFFVGYLFPPPTEESTGPSQQ